ncbi:uncharacterized protein LOC100890089 isoform X4 [Strongylocentrotus purpuratus]|uniref:ABC transporter domain-containing protein n=1 Tax=Strongylocentrotus purpuratus TaxID=7668 RepID=A0A7M7NST0_STRPU|nr:uncharacterized protein LOC100890089 isoform X4 [Strongylocentrotus purpuratus]
MLVPNATALEFLLAQHTPFSRDLIDAFIYTPINPTKLIELAISDNWNTTLCTEEGLRMLFVLPEGLNVTNLQGALCSVDFQKTLTELLENGAIENIISVIIDQLYLSIIPELTLPDFDLTALTDLIPRIISGVRTGNMQNIGQYFESLNSLTVMFSNETWYQDTIRQLQFMDFITKTFADKIIMLEGRSITFPELGNLLANSSEIQRILLDDYSVSFGIVEAMMTLSLQPEKLISFFNMSNPFVTLCATGQFSSFFYSPLNPEFDISSLEQAVCKIDFEQLVMEFKDLVSFDEILEQIQLSASTNQTGPYNWTAAYVTDERLTQAISQLTVNPPQLTLDEVWVNKTLETLISLGDRLNKAQERLSGVSPSDISSSFDSLAEILEQGIMANQSWAIEMASSLRTINGVLGYTNNKLWPLPGRNITLQDLLPPDIATYIESTSDLTPDVIALLLHSSVNTASLLVANATWLDALCSDAQSLPLMLQLPPDVDVDAAHQAICYIDYDQWTDSYEQEIQSILIEVESGKEVNFTSITENFQKLSLGIQTLIENPPTLLKYNEEWFQSIILRTGAILQTTFNDTRFYTDPNSISLLLNEMWNQIAVSDPSLLIQARMNDYFTQIILDNLKMFPGRTYTFPKLDELFGDTTYVRELLSHSDIAPEIIDTFMILAVDQQKIVYLASTPNVFVELCQTGQFSTFFQLPPDSPTDITLVEDAFCKTNLTLVLAELDQKFKFSETATKFQRIISSDPTLPPFNQTAASLRMIELSNLITALIETPPTVTVDLVWWENVYNRSEVIVMQWLQRLTEQAMNGSSVPGLELVLAQLGTLDIPGFDVDQFEMWIGQTQHIPTLITQLLSGQATNVSTAVIVPILQELFPDPDLMRELLNSTGLPQDVIEVFLQMRLQLTKWLPMLTSPDPLTAVCEGGLFKDIFILANTSIDIQSIDIQSIEDQICSLNLTDINGLLSELFTSDLDAVVLELVKVFYQVPGLDLQTALNVSREISAIISNLISDPTNFELNPMSIIELLQSLDIPGLNETSVQDWLKQVQLMQYINDVIADLLASNNGTEFAIPTFNELFPDPTIVVQLLTDLGVPNDVTEAFLYMAVQADQWTEIWMKPDPLQAVCNTSLFQDIFTQTLNSSIDIQTIQATLCSLNLSDIDALLNDIFNANGMIVQLVQVFYQVPDFDLQTALNVSREISAIISNLISDPTNFELNPMSIIELLQSLDIRGLNETSVQDWLKQAQLMQYINDVIADLLASNNGTEFAIPTFNELFPDPTVVVQLLTDLGVPNDITEAFLYMAVQADQWTEIWMKPDPLQAVCNTSLFQDIFTQTLNSSIDIQTIQATLCSLNLSDIDALLNDIFEANSMIVQLVQIFYQVPDFDLQTALNVSREISEIISNLISNPANFELDPQSIIKLLQSLRVPGLNETWVQDWLNQVQLTQYANDIIGWLASGNGTEFAIPTFNELFPDPTIVVQLLTDLGVPYDITEAFLYMAVQADQWTEIWMKPDPLQAVCNTSLFQDIFTQTLNSSIDIQTIQATLCSLNLSDIDALLNDIFKTNGMIVQLVQVFYQVPDFDLQTALNVSQEISAIISNLISNPAKFELDPQSIIELLQSLDVPGLNETWVQDWLKQVQLMQYINDVFADLLASNNGTEFAIPTFNDLFPDPTIIVQLLTDLGVPDDITEAFLYMAVQADQWTEIWMKPDPLQAVCDTSLFQDIFTQTLNSSVDIQTIQATLCSLNLSDIDALLNDVFKANGVIVQLVQVFYQVPGFDLQTALNISQEISAIISKLISDPTNFELNPQSIIELLQSLDIPGLNETWVQDWLKQVQLMQYINDVIADLLASNNGTEFAIPTFNELFSDPTIVVQLLTDLGVPSDITEAFLYMAVQADQWTEIWMKPDPLQAVCDTSLFQDIFTQTLNSAIDIQTIQATLCSLNLSDIDALLNDIFKANGMIVQISILLFNDPTMDWATAWNISIYFSQMFDELFQNPPMIEQDIKQLTLSLFSELESMLRMYGVWDEAEHYLKYVEFYLQVVGHHLGNSNNFLKDLFDPTVSLDTLVRYVGMSPEEIRTALLGDVTDISFLAELYYGDGDWNYLFYCDDKEQFESNYNTTNDGFLDLFAVREAFCSLNISEFFETAKNIYGFDFLRLAELESIRSRNGSSPGLDIESLVDVATDIAQMITDLANLPSMLTKDLDLDFFLMRLTNLSNAIDEQDYEQLIALLGELAPLLRSPDIVYQIQASLMSSSDILSWFESIDSTDPVTWLERIEGALNETLLWHTILPALNFVDLLIEVDLDALNPLGYKYYDLITNETALQQYLTDLLGLAPEYAEAITLSGVKDVLVLADHHLSGTWESTYCVTVDSANGTDLNLTAVYSLLCNLDREQFFESLNTLMGIDVLRLTQWIGDVTNPERGVVQRFDWQTLVGNVQSHIDTLTGLTSIGQIGGVNVTQVENLIQKLQQGIEQFDYEVLIEQMEILNQILYLNGEWDNIKGYINAVTNIVEWINPQLENAHANNVTLSELITHHATVLQNLYYALGSDLFPQLITALVNPQQAMTLNTHDDIETVVCDADSFNELLKPTLYSDTNSLQTSLCSHLMSGHPTIANDLMTHFNIAPLEHEITVLATNNFDLGFQDQDIDMRRMVNEFEKLSNGLILITIRDVMNHAGLNITMLPTIDNLDDILMMVSGSLTSTLPALPLWDEVFYPILGRLDLAMIMVEDLFFSLPDREAEIQTVLDNDTIVNAAIPVILTEVPKVIMAWNEVMEQPLQIPVLSKLIIELLKGSFEGISELDPSFLSDFLTPGNSTNGSSTAVFDLIVSLNTMLVTDFGQQLLDVFRIRENAERLDIITDFDSKDLPPFDAAFIGRSKDFVEKAMDCAANPDGCIVDLQAPPTLDLLVKLIEIPNQLPEGSLESLGDVFVILAPVVEDLFQQLGNGTGEFGNSLNLVFSFLRTVFESNKVPLTDVLSIFEFEEALLNGSSIYQFLKENTDLTEIDLLTLRNSSINATVLFKLFDLGVKDSVNLPCNEALLDDLLLDVDSTLKEEILKGLCSNGTLIAVEFFRTNIDLKTVIDLINKNAGQTFPEFLLETFNAIGNLSEVDYEALGEFVAIVLPALFDDGVPTISDLDTLAENINITIRALRSVDALLTLTEGLFKDFPTYRDVQQLIRTLLDNIYVLELLAEIPDLTVNNILKDERVLQDFLVENTALQQSEARDITYATFNLEELFLTEITKLLEKLCDPDYLSTILIFSNQTNATILADTMCGLSGDQVATLIETALPFIDVSAIVNVSYLADSFGGAFSISNETISQVMQSIESLEAVTMALPALQEAIASFNDDPAIERLREMAELGFFTGEEISAVTQEIVCGSTSLRKRRATEDFIRTFEDATITENKDDFCVNIFSSIVDGIDGRLVWAYLKPIVAGSILYSPDIAPVRRIIEKANRTFENIALTQRFAKVWLRSEGDLGTALDPDTLTATMTLLENSYVQGLLEDQYGINSDMFTDVLSGNLTSMDPGQIQTLNLLAELVSNLTTCFNLNRFIGYDNEAAMVEDARSFDKDNTLLAALAFDIPADATELPAHIKYKIRMDSDNTPPTDMLRDIFLTRSSANDFVFDLRYLRGYIMLQDMVEGSIVSLQASPDIQPPGVYLQMTPYPCYLNDEFSAIFTLVLPLVMTISFVVLIGVMTHQLVYEKERGIEELMKVMGLPAGANWWAWFISNSLLLVLLSCVVVIIMTYGNILPMTDWSLLLVFILDYFFSLIMFCYLASAVFQRASIASLASILVYLIFYLPYIAIFASESLLDALWKLIVPCIFFPSTFSIGCLVISQFENMGVGAQWHLIWNNALDEEISSMAFVLIALAVDGAVYLILGWYIKTLFPGKYGVPRKWYFPLQPSFWCPCSISKKHDMQQYINSAFDPESGVALTSQDPVVEEDPSNHPVGIAILNLTKVYRSCFKEEKVAVDSLSLNFFEGQVTAVLGHNGAGKTTTINIITGLFPATSGKVYLQGVNVSKKAMSTRENLGVCVQHNALYENLTVREHMAMTGRVKGLRGKALDDDIYNLLQDVGLLKKSEERVKNLSGGMKRKLSVAMAFVGHSTIIILDEPTSGVDPHARRAIWNLIMKQKTGRTIVLCTHFMDEADILGDRIAILDQGHLRCCGSPAFLKSRFSSGYRLSLAKEATSGGGTPTDHGAEDFKTEAVPNIYDTMRTATSDVPSTSSGIATDPGSSFDTSNVTDFIQARIPSARLQDDIGTELVYVLPVDSGEREKFQELFEDLDSSLGELCIKSYGISDTTLKEVFLKVSTGTSRSVDEEAGILKNNNWSLRKGGQTFSIATGITHEDKPYQPYGHLVKAVLLSAWGMLIKRLHFVRRDWQGLIWTILMPVVLVALAIGFSQLSQLDPENPRQLTPAMFNPNSYAFFSDESEGEIGQRLTDALINPPGLGTTCMADADQKDLYPCVESNAHLIDQLYNYNLSLLAEVPEDQCRCTETGFGQECEADAGGIPPPTWLTDTQVFLQDISVKEDKDRYLLDTQLQFRNSRFGGVSWFDDMESNQTQAKAWYNNRAYHAMPTFLNVMNNIILRATVNNNSHEYGITAYNHPLKLSKQDLGINIWLDAAKTFGIVIVIVAALVLIPSAFSMFLVNENINGSKRLHYVSGVGTLTYWLTNLFWDMLSFCIPVGLMLLVFYIFDFRGLILTSNVGAFVALVFLYGFAIMCQIYILIPFFKESGTAFIFLFCLLLLAAVITNLPNFLVLVNAVSEREKQVFEILNYVFLVFSPYCLSSGLLALIQNQALADIYQAFGMEEGIYEDPFVFLKWHFIALAAEGGLAFLILLIVDAVRNSACSSCLDPNVDNLLPGYHDNEDVREEMEMVNRGGSKEDTLVLTEVRKVYRGPGRQKIVAVNDLCLAVSKGECFGLLGVNGAGKTSTFRMIVEDLSPTEGTIKKRAKSIGYCPQENAMYPQLTGEELLYCYARMKGINSSGMSKAIEEICQELGMEKYLRRRISTYSGGMKRSLAVAVALLGRPELILMDEPTTGMDPITKQRVLNSIVNVVRDNRSVILTSHSMEECEAVCTRLAIMVNGQFCCLGSPQHVKNRHGNGYSLVVRGQKMGKTDMSLITEFVHRSFPGAELKEHHHNVVRFQLPPHNITVATIFGIMEREKSTLNLEDYSVSQTTLDEVFVNFAKKQTDGLEDETSSTASAHEVSIINRAFEPDQDLDVDVFPKNTKSAATHL